MSYTRREFGKLALAGLPAAAVIGNSQSIFGAFAQAKPNSVFNGVQIGTITYSYRSMQDQSAEATLRYILDSGISAVELMGGPIQSYAGIPTAEGGGGGGGGRGPGGRGERGAVPVELPPGARKGAWNGTECVIPAPGGGPGGAR